MPAEVGQSGGRPLLSPLITGGQVAAAATQKPGAAGIKLTTGGTEPNTPIKWSDTHTIILIQLVYCDTFLLIRIRVPYISLTKRPLMTN